MSFGKRGRRHATLIYHRPLLAAERFAGLRTSVLEFLSAPACSRTLMFSVMLLAAAECRGDQPVSVRASLFAPFWMSRATLSDGPYAAA